jgi:hypothetical protein
MAMTTDLIPQDPLTRRQLARVLAQMIREDFEKARAGGSGSQPVTTGADDGDDLEDRRQVYSTPGTV